MKDTKKKKIVGVTFGAMDLCHAGHMLMLKECKKHCDHLIVGLQDDPSLDNDKNKEYRGKLKNQPVMSVVERKIILEGIKYVDEVFVYSTEEDLYQWLKNNKYDIRIIGADWKGKKYTGWDLPHKIHFNERNHTYSTSELRRRVYHAEKRVIESEASEKTLEKARQMPIKSKVFASK
jgi:glycerol-3-phosphate cytidylyltransferase